jgi:hypothetical protein
MFIYAIITVSGIHLQYAPFRARFLSIRWHFDEIGSAQTTVLLS